MKKNKHTKKANSSKSYKLQEKFDVKQLSDKTIDLVKTQKNIPSNFDSCTKKSSFIDILKMFFAFFRIGLFTIGGGYAMIPIIEVEFVEKRKLITSDEFLNAVAISQSIPGVLSVNAAAYIGYKLYGIKGALSAILGTILPSILIIIFIAIYFDELIKKKIVNSIFNGLRPAVVATILYSFYKMAKNLDRTIVNVIIFFVTVILITYFKVNPVFVIIFAGIFGLVFYKNTEDKNV